jgi:hypothetical protein
MYCCFFRASHKIKIESRCIVFSGLHIRSESTQNVLLFFTGPYSETESSQNILLFLQGFIQNQNRVSTLKDKSILPDLCSSHKKQLLVMVSNHKKIQETKKKCKMAKEELAINLHARLRYDFLLSL